MTVRTTGNITFGEQDFTRTDRGVTWGIKLTSTNDWRFVAVFVRVSGAWGIDEIPESQLDSDFDASMNFYGNDLNAWYHGKLIPALNKWLKTLPAVGAEQSKTSLAEQADKMIQGIKITENADGTLTAS